MKYREFKLLLEPVCINSVCPRFKEYSQNLYWGQAGARIYSPAWLLVTVTMNTVIYIATAISSVLISNCFCVIFHLYQEAKPYSEQSNQNDDFCQALPEIELR